jgi:hypothetical protein
MKDLKVHGTAPDFNGEKNPNSVATPEQVEYIRKYHRKGRGPYDKGNTMLIARRLGLTRVIVLAISRGDTWNASDRL